MRGKLAAFIADSESDVVVDVVVPVFSCRCRCCRGIVDQCESSLLYRKQRGSKILLQRVSCSSQVENVKVTGDGEMAGLK